MIKEDHCKHTIRLFTFIAKQFEASTASETPWPSDFMRRNYWALWSETLFSQVLHNRIWTVFIFSHRVWTGVLSALFQTGAALLPYSELPQLEQHMFSECHSCQASLCVGTLLTFLFRNASLCGATQLPRVFWPDFPWEVGYALSYKNLYFLGMRKYTYLVRLEPFLKLK